MQHHQPCVPSYSTLLQLRHPNILAFKDSIEVQEKGQQVLYLVTEAVRPLITVLKELHLSGQHRWDQHTWTNSSSRSSSWRGAISRRGSTAASCTPWHLA
jgi:hypothetical protein